MSKEKLIKRNPASHIIPHTSQKGITLIALVVTIIVMLILAGVVINTVLGDDGIISRAEDSKKEQIEKEDMEAIKLAVSGQDILTIAEFEPTGYEKADAIERELATKYGVDNINVREEPTGSDVFIVTINGKRNYKVNSDKQIVKLPDETTTANPITTSVTTTNPTSQATASPASTTTVTPTPTPTPTPTVTPSPTPTPTPISNTVTVTYKLGIETIHTEEVEVGSTFVMDEDDYQWMNNERGFMQNGDWGWGYGWSTSPMEPVNYDTTYVITEDTTLYGYPTTWDLISKSLLKSTNYICLVTMETLEAEGYVNATSSNHTLRYKCTLY